ncbi:unnamed protein product, partial [Prorocentrum cordatum]
MGAAPTGRSEAAAALRDWPRLLSGRRARSESGSAPVDSDRGGSVRPRQLEPARGTAPAVVAPVSSPARSALSARRPLSRGAARLCRRLAARLPCWNAPRIAPSRSPTLARSTPAGFSTAAAGMPESSSAAPPAGLASRRRGLERPPRTQGDGTRPGHRRDEGRGEGGGREGSPEEEEEKEEEEQDGTRKANQRRPRPRLRSRCWPRCRPPLRPRRLRLRSRSAFFSS